MAAEDEAEVEAEAEELALLVRGDEEDKRGDFDILTASITIVDRAL